MKRLLETLSDIPDAVFIRDTAIVKNHFSRLACAHSQFVFFFAAAKSFHSTLDNKCSGIISCSGFSGSCNEHSYICTLPVGDPAFCTIYYPVISLLYGRALHVACITPCICLSHPPCANGFPGGSDGRYFSF